MAIEFRTQKLRDAMALRLTALAVAMIRSRDQGHDGRLMATDEMIDDVRSAAYIVGLMPARDDGQQTREKED